MDNGVAYIGPSDKDVEELTDLLLLHHDIVVIDTETPDEVDRTPIGIGIALSPKEAFYFRIRPDPSPYLWKIAKILSDSMTHKIYHNALFDLEVEWNLCEEMGWVRPDTFNIGDTNTRANVQGFPGSLQNLTYALTGKYIPSIKDILPPGKNMLDLDWDVVANKCLSDVMHTYEVWEKLPPTTNDCYDVDMKIIPMLIRMSRRGLKLRPEVVEEWYKELSYKKLMYEDMCSSLEFSPSSPQQVGLILARRGNFLPWTKTRKQYKTDDDVLRFVEDPIAQLVLNYRQTSTRLSNFVIPWRGESRAHSRFRFDLATGRTASSGDKKKKGKSASRKNWRNMQNIPPDMRNMFEPDSPTEEWTDADLSQVEMRIFAFLSQDPVMLEAYRNNYDIHDITQQALWPGTSKLDKSIRTKAKAYNFSMIFDASDHIMAVKNGLTKKQAGVFKKLWFGQYSKAYEWMQETMGLDTNYVETQFGRRMLLPRIEDFPEDHINKCKINYQVQGTAADILKRIMLKLFTYDVALQVHDEILIDGRVDIDPELSQIHPDIPTPFGDIKRGAIWY